MFVPSPMIQSFSVLLHDHWPCQHSTLPPRHRNTPRPHPHKKGLWAPYTEGLCTARDSKIERAPPCKWESEKKTKKSKSDTNKSNWAPAVIFSLATLLEVVEGAAYSEEGITISLYRYITISLYHYIVKMRMKNVTKMHFYLAALWKFVTGYLHIVRVL